MAKEQLFERKYYFGWYQWNGFTYCERWDGDVGSNCRCYVKTQITEAEWNGPLSILEERYKSLQSKID